MPHRRAALLPALAGLLLSAGLLSATAGAAPRLAEPLPRWVAPGVEVTVRVVPDATGALRLERRVPGGWRTVARAPVRRGGTVNLRYTPRDPGGHRLRLVGADRRGAIAKPGTAPAPRTVRTLRPLAVRPVTLVALGDVSPGSAAPAVRANGPDWHWQIVGPWLHAQDLVVMNWETADAPAGPPWPNKAFNFLAPRGSIAAAARTGGVDAASLANNHAADFGRPALLRSMRTMRGAGIAPFGAGADLGASLRPAIIRAGGLRIALLGFNGIQPIDFWAAPGRAGTTPATPETIRRPVGAARRQADLVIPYFHWGIELDRRPSAGQRQMADIAFAAGADIVLGAHPHVIQPVERRGGGRLVAWSLGNFLFSPGSVAGTHSAALRLHLGAGGVRRHELVPVRLIGTRPVFTRTPPR